VAFSRSSRGDVIFLIFLLFL